MAGLGTACFRPYSLLFINFILALRGVFDGQQVSLLEQGPVGRRYNVIITFVEETSDQEEVRQFSAQTNSFAFWHDEREDVYQDYLPRA